MLGEQLYPYSFHGSSFPRIVMLPNVCPAPGRMQREPVRWRERRPMCFLQSFRRMSRADLRAFFCRMLAEVGLAPEARYREQPGGVRRVDQVALRRLALDLQDCPFFFFCTGLDRHVENLRSVSSSCLGHLATRSANVYIVFPLKESIRELRASSSSTLSTHTADCAEQIDSIF